MGSGSEEQTWRPLTPSITGDEAERVVAAAGAVIIHVWAEWNLYDRSMDEIIQIFRADFENEIRFYSLDSGPESNWAFCVKHKVLNIPALICSVNGRHTETIIGLRSEEEWRSIIQRMIKSEIE